MASYKDVLRLIREGKTAVQIREALPMNPSRMKRILAGPRFNQELEKEELLARLISRYRRPKAKDRVARQRLGILGARNGWNEGWGTWE